MSVVEFHDMLNAGCYLFKYYITKIPQSVIILRAAVNVPWNIHQYIRYIIDNVLLERNSIVLRGLTDNYYTADAVINEHFLSY